MALASALDVAAAEATRMAFDLPADSAERSLKRFSEQAGREVLFASHITRGVRANPVKGELAPREAIERLLANTGLVAVHEAKTGAFSVRTETPEEGKTRKRTAPATAGDPSRDAEKKKQTAPARTQEPMKRNKLLTKLTAVIALLIGSPTSAQTPATTGTIRGTVFNPVTGEYVRNADIRVEGTAASDVSGTGGAYTLAAVPAGPATIIVSHTGYPSSTQTVNVPAGGVVTANFELKSAEARVGPTETVRLDAFVVSSEREGNAKAIQEQKRSMGISSIVASDTFQNVVDGNAGEFLKNMAGVDIDEVAADARAIRLGGLPAQYTAVTINGMSTASADALFAAGGGNDTRSFGTGAMSLSSVDSVEVNFIRNADQDANGAAGSVNFRTKKAFDRKGRRIGYTAGLSGVHDDMTLGKSYGPNDRKNYKLLPKAAVEFSDVILGDRLGVVVNVNEENIYNQIHRVTMTYDTATTAADQRPIVPRILIYFDQPTFTERFSANLNLDCKVSPNLSLSLAGSYNHQVAAFYQRTFTLTATRANTIVSPDLLQMDATNATAAIGTNSSNKKIQSKAISPSFEYRAGRIELDGAFSHSTSRNRYVSLDDGFLRTVGTTAVSGVGWRASRPGIDDVDWTVTQVGGPDFGDLANYGNTTIGDYARFHIQDFSIGRLDLKVKTKWSWLDWFKAGLKATETSNEYGDSSNYRTWNYVGPTVAGGATRNPGLYPSRYVVNPTWLGGGIRTLGGAPLRLQLPDGGTLAGLLRDHPEYFTFAPTVANYTTLYSNNRSITENFRAAYLMGYWKWGRFAVQGGLRWEGTDVKGKNADALRGSELVAAGFPVDASGNPTTLAGVDYKYTAKPKVLREGSTEFYSPTVSFKYSFTPDFQAQLGYGKSITRPGFNSIAGVWAFNEATSTASAPNPNLGPETSDKITGRLVYYFEPVGSFEITAFQQEVSDRIASIGGLPAADFGYGNDPVFASWTFSTTTNAALTTRYRGYSLSYRQTLGFLPKALGTTNVYANYMRNIANQRINLMRPHTVNFGLSNRFRRLSSSVSLNYTGTAPTDSVVGNFDAPRTRLDLNLSYDCKRWASFFLQVRNLTDAPLITYRFDNPAMVYRVNKYGANVSLGMKGTF